MHLILYHHIRSYDGRAYKTQQGMEVLFVLAVLQRKLPSGVSCKQRRGSGALSRKLHCAIIPLQTLSSHLVGHMPCQQCSLA